MPDDSEFNLEDRVLCSDEACIGTVGPDGKCKVCGLEYTGDEPLPGTEGATPASDAKPEEESSEPGECDEAAASAPSDPDERICCPDEACIGIIGPDGKCGTCGRKG